MKRIFAGILAASLSAMATPVDDIGALSVQNGQVVGATGQPANLRGMSLFWNIAPEARDYYNANVVNWLAEDWHINLIRAPMAVEDNWGAGQEGYEYQPDRNKAMITTIVDAAIAKGIYVIIDWHSSWSADNSQPQRQTKAIAFFQEMATTYGGYPNVIYEVYNEPGFGESDWPKIKTYENAVISAIRAIDPDNLIIAGTPAYSSAPDIATAAPLDNNTNIAYSFHFYASEPWHDNYKPKAQTALDRGYALFVSEWGVSWANGGGTLDYTRMQSWLDWLGTKNLSWAAWSIANKNESSSALKTSASASGNWSASDLSESGTWYKQKLSGLNPAWSAATPIRSGTQAPSVFSVRTGNSGTLQVSFPTGCYTHLRALDLQGRKLATQDINKSEKTVSLQGLSTGVVLLELTDGKGLRVNRTVLVK